MILLKAAAAATVFSLLPSPGASAASSTDCTEYGVDYNGYDILVLRDVDAHPKCRQSCAEDVNCHYWSYEAETSTCFLKSAAAILGRVDKDNIVSGPKICTAEEGCFEVGYDYVGFDVMRIDGQNIPSAVECQKICVLNPHCAFFSYKASNQGCYLKASGARVGRIADPDVTSGPRVCAASPDSPTFLPRQGCAEGSVEYLGHDVQITPSVRSAPHCQQLCAANSMCFYWTWDGNKNTCYEKDAAAVDFRQAGTHTLGKVSGAKNCIPINPGCQHMDVSFKGEAIRKLRNSTFEACQANCQSDPNCAFWSWNASNKLCQLRQQTPFGYVSAPGTIAGPKYCPNNDLCIEQADYVGYDIDSIEDGSVPSATECRVLCRKKEGCELWTWVENGNCYLKTAEALKGKINGLPSIGRYSGPRECFMSYGCIDTNAAYLSRDATRLKNIESYKACGEQCALEHCQVWTYLTSSRTCLLLENIPDMISLDGAISGKRDCNKATTHTCLSTGVKYKEYELLFDANVASVTDCQKACARNFACETFTFEHGVGCYQYDIPQSKLHPFRTKYPAAVSGPDFCRETDPSVKTKTLGPVNAATRAECKKRCLNDAACLWHSFEADENGTRCMITVRQTQSSGGTYGGYRYNGEALLSSTAKNADDCREQCSGAGYALWTYYSDSQRCDMFGDDVRMSRTKDIHATCGTAEDPAVFPLTLVTSDGVDHAENKKLCSESCSDCWAWSFSEKTCMLARRDHMLSPKEDSITRFVFVSKRPVQGSGGSLN